MLAKLVLTRNGDFIAPGRKFRRRTINGAKARLPEIKKPLPAI